MTAAGGILHRPLLQARVPPPGNYFASGTEENPVSRIVSLIAVGIVQHIEVIEEVRRVGRRDVDAGQYTPVVRAMIAIVEQRYVPARADRLQEFQQGTLALGKLEAIEPLAGDAAVDVPAHHVTDVQLRDFV